MDVNEMAAAVFKSVRGYVLQALAPLADRIKALESELAALPAPSIVTAEEVLPPLRAELARAVAEFPRPKDGKDGESVTVEDVHPVLMLELSKWALDFERRAQDVLERAIARMPPPKDGKDGVDGFSLEHFDAQLDEDGRTVVLSFTADGRRFERRLAFPVVIDRGFWRDGMEVTKGDGVTFGGSYWIAQTDTATKPEIGNPDWRLGVKKGRDGKDGRP